MADTTSTRTTFDLLRDDENYSSWSVQLTDILTELGLEDHIEEGARAPADDDGNVWKKLDRKVLSTIRLRITPALVVHVADAKTALEAWTILSDMFLSKGTLGIVLARRKFYASRLDTSTTKLEDHIRQMRTYTDKLRTLGYPLAAEDFSLTLLTSLPASWDSFISAAIDDETLKQSNKVISRIIAEHQRQEDRNGASMGTTGDTALAVASRLGRSYRRTQATQQSSNDITCHRCGGRGHYARSCATSAEDKVNFAYNGGDDYAF